MSAAARTCAPWARARPALLAGALLLAACSGQPPRPRLAEQLAAVGVELAAADPVLLDDEMRAWAHAALPPDTPPGERLERLLAAIVRRPERPLRYRPGTTTGARDVWASGLANCLSFSHLFVAMARELGLEAYYLRVRELGSFDREGDLVVVSDHVTAASGPGSNRLILDFSDRPIRRYFALEPLADLRALALHYSNLGAEAIRGGRTAEARERLELATRIDPGLADGWVNLGVARRRSGDAAGAEAAYRRALDADPEHASALFNLTTLLERLGRTAESQRLLDAASGSRLRNPWTALALGEIALRGGRPADAERLFRRAARLMPASGTPWAALAECALATGDRAAARRHLARALRLEPGLPAALSVQGRAAEPE